MRLTIVTTLDLTGLVSDQPATSHTQTQICPKFGRKKRKPAFLLSTTPSSNLTASARMKCKAVNLCKQTGLKALQKLAALFFPVQLHSSQCALLGGMVVGINSTVWVRNAKDRCTTHRHQDKSSQAGRYSGLTRLR